jgi:16S rRNA (guanine966-N2)-methyltransferase
MGSGHSGPSSMVYRLLSHTIKAGFSGPMRVIAGTEKGRNLQSVPGDSTRPITDRVKSALFSILGSQDMVEGRRFLDLFGGTGAVGIEALSRGAASAVFCERDPSAVRTLRRNLEATRLAGRSQVVVGDAFAYLGRVDLPIFDVIYIAPPQYRELWLKALRLVDARPDILADGGLVIVQIFPKEWSDFPLDHLTLYDRRQYGSTTLCFYDRSSSTA